MTTQPQPQATPCADPVRCAAIDRLARIAAEPCHALGLAVAVRALDQQATADQAEQAWKTDLPLPAGGLGSRVAWSIGPSAEPLDLLAGWTDRRGQQAGGAIPLSIARSFRAWLTAEAQDATALRHVPEA